jgi:hypothetical protein
VNRYRDHAAEYAASSRAKARRARIAPIVRRPPPPCVRRGIENARAKVTEVQVMLIRLMHMIGYDLSWLSVIFGLGKIAIGRIIKRDTWSHV